MESTHFDRRSNACISLGVLVTGTLLAVGVAAITGCAAEEPDSPQPQQHRVTTLEADPSQGKLVLQFTDAGRSITFDMRLGRKMAIPPSADDLAAHPELPSFEIDAQILDNDGRAFFMQMGGDGYIDPTWTMPTVDGFDEAMRQNDFAMVSTAAAAVRSTRVPDELEQLRLGILSIANTIDGVAEKPGMDEDAIARLAPCELCRGGTSVTKWDFYTSVHPVAVLGEHSAVMLRGWTSGSRVAYTTVSCNHGSCANASNMKRKCTMPGFRSDDGSHTRWFQANGCSTHYNARSAGGHNCNDDSELQQRAIWNDRYQSTTANECNDSGWHIWMPTYHCE